MVSKELPLKQRTDFLLNNQNQLEKMIIRNLSEDKLEIWYTISYKVEIKL